MKMDNYTEFDIYGDDIYYCSSLQYRFAHLKPNR